MAKKGNPYWKQFERKSVWLDWH